MMKKVLCLLLCLMILVGVLPVNASAATTIRKITLDLEYPEAGKTPPGTATWHGEGYYLYSIDWYDVYEMRFLEPGEKIQAGHSYDAILWVEAADGYVFSTVDDNTPSVTATVNGESAMVEKAYEYKAWAMVTVTYCFYAVPEKGWISTVDLTIPAPVVGEKPFYAKISTESYELNNVYFNDHTDPNMKNGISWYRVSDNEQLSPDSEDTFAAETAYRFHCLVFPQDGYRIKDNAVVRVNGKKAEAYLDYGTFLSVRYEFPPTGAAHVHTVSEWRTTGAYHYTVCTTCGDMLEQEDHYGGVISCAEPAICVVCGYLYAQPHENHTPDTSKWVARIDMYHFHPCMYCGAHCDIEDHKPGPAATETTPQTCTVCGYILAPVKEHKHNLVKIPQKPADCTHEGNIEYYYCTGCENRFTDAAAKNKIPEKSSVKVGALGHTISDSWSRDGEFHWRTCVTCAVVLEETKMLHEFENGKCTTCGYVQTKESEPDETTEPTQVTESTQNTDPTIDTEPTQNTEPTVDTEPTQNTEPKPSTKPTDDTETTPSTDAPNTQTPTPEKEKNINWATAVMIGLVCFGASVTATVVILKRKKK